MLVTKAYLMKVMIAISASWEMEPPNVDDVHCMAEALWFESRGQATEEWMMVGTVIQKRKRVKRWPNTVCKVIQNKSQFSYYWDGKSDRIYLTNPTKVKLYYDIVERAFIMNKGIEVDMDSYHFYNKHIEKGKILEPRWAKYGVEEKLKGWNLVHTITVLPKKYW